MNFLQNNLLTILIVLPTIGAVVAMLARGRDGARWAAVGTTLVTFLLSLLILVAYDWDKGGNVYGYDKEHGGNVQMVRAVKWIPAFNIEYRVGIDGLSMPLVILSTFICLLAAIASWKIEKMTRGYMALFLFLETGILGVFLSLDFFLF